MSNKTPALNLAIRVLTILLVGLVFLSCLKGYEKWSENHKKTHPLVKPETQPQPETKPIAEPKPQFEKNEKGERDTSENERIKSKVDLSKPHMTPVEYRKWRDKRRKVQRSETLTNIEEMKKEGIILTLPTE